MILENMVPRQKLIWPGAMLGSIAHAVFVCHSPDFSHEQSWDGTNYSIQDSAGSCGTIAFFENKFVGVFFREDSDRNPFHFSSSYQLDNFFVGLPQELWSLAYDEALQYVLQNLNGITVPVITSAFWGDGSEWVAAAEPWVNVFKYGASLIRNQLLDLDESVRQWSLDYSLSDIEIDFVTSLFKKRCENRRALITLDGMDLHLWNLIASGQEGAEASRESFAEIGIIVPTS